MNFIVEASTLAKLAASGVVGSALLGGIWVGSIDQKVSTVAEDHDRLVRMEAQQEAMAEDVEAIMEYLKDNRGTIRGSSSDE